MKHLSCSCLALSICVLLLTASTAFARDISLADGHIHYNQDIQEQLPPEQAIKLLQAAGIHRALVSATPSSGAILLQQQAPDIVIPMLRPYKSLRHRYYWHRDSELIAYLQQQLAQSAYHGIGEFHLFGEQAETPPVAAMLQLAEQQKLLLHAHANQTAMIIILQQVKQSPVIWAHAGFDIPLPVLRELMAQYPNLYLELSLREGMLDEEGQLQPHWHKFLIDYQQRIITGSDTYIPRRWAELSEITSETRQWLRQLPGSAAQNIASNNLQRLGRYSGH